MTNTLSKNLQAFLSILEDIKLTEKQKALEIQSLQLTDEEKQTCSIEIENPRPLSNTKFTLFQTAASSASSTFQLSVSVITVSPLGLVVTYNLAKLTQELINDNFNTECLCQKSLTFSETKDAAEDLNFKVTLSGLSFAAQLCLPKPMLEFIRDGRWCAKDEDIYSFSDVELVAEARLDRIARFRESERICEVGREYLEKAVEPALVYLVLTDRKVQELVEQYSLHEVAELSALQQVLNRPNKTLSRI